MARSPNQKRKLLCLCQLLWERTDEEHPLTVQELIDALEGMDIHAERKSIYDDMETLRTFGLDVQSRKGKAPGWFLGERPFELPELKLLVDAVQACRFITRRKSDALIRKLESLSSVHQARQLQRQVYVAGRVKAMNESVYYTIDKLHTALNAPGGDLQILRVQHAQGEGLPPGREALRRVPLRTDLGQRELLPGRI